MPSIKIKWPFSLTSTNKSTLIYEGICPKRAFFNQPFRKIFSLHLLLKTSRHFDFSSISAPGNFIFTFTDSQQAPVTTLGWRAIFSFRTRLNYSFLWMKCFTGMLKQQTSSLSSVFLSSRHNRRMVSNCFPKRSTFGEHTTTFSV